MPIPRLDEKVMGEVRTTTAPAPVRSTAPMPTSPVRRAATALGSLILLAGLVGGLPVALVLLAGNPLPSDLPSPGGIWSVLTSPDDGSLFLSMLAIVGWLAWASFTFSVAVELGSTLTRRQAPAIPGLRGQQRFAAVLIAAIAALSASPTLTNASAALVDAPPAATAMAGAPDQVVVRGLGAANPEQPIHRGLGTAPERATLHLVERGEGLLDLQDRYGVPWHRIAEMNYGVEQPDGRTLERGQTRIYPGWQLQIPTASITPPSAPQIGFGARDDGADPVPATAATAAPDQAQPAEYEVAQGDWMWHIADRYLGDPERYRDIAALNPQYADQHGNFPDHIEPGWTLRLPDDAVDSGPARHATGTATTPEAPDPGPEPEPTPEPEPAAAPPPVAPPESSPVVVGFGTAPTDPVDHPGQGTDREDRHGFDAGVDVGLDRLAPAAFAGAGLLTALVLGAAGLQIRRRRQHHRPGNRFAAPAATRLEKTLRTAQQPLDAARLDAALRTLAAGLARWTRPLPDIAGAMVDGGSVHLLLAAPCPDPPPPWHDNGDRWTLPAGTPLPALAGSTPLAPLPTLAAIGSQAGVHLLLDLERLGFLAIHGDPHRALDLLRYLAAELACNTWSDAAQILVAGFEPREAELLVTLNPERVRALPSIADAVALLRQRAGSARATLSHTGTADAVTGRMRDLAGDAWRPQVLLAAAPTPADMAALAELERLPEGSRCAVAVATADRHPPRHDAWRVTVTPDGVVHVRLPFLRASLSAAALPAAELMPLAETVRAARSAAQVPVPPAGEVERWAAGTSADGVPRPPAPNPPAAKSGLPDPTTAPIEPSTDHGLTFDQDLSVDPDLTLDQDLRAWHEGSPGRPRIGVLGPVFVDAPGPPPESRRRLHAELVVYLAQRGGRGADGTLLDQALWPDVPATEPTRERLLSRVRRWLDTDPAGGPWLPDVGADLCYRLAEGYLFDWHLFRRLRIRGRRRGPDGIEDLRAALRLVRGVPLDGADRPRVPGTRNPYPWLAESDMHPEHVMAAIIDTGHELAELCLATGDPAGARFAVQQAWLADPGRTFDQPWRDLLRAEHADGQTGQLRSILAELMEARDADAPEDLAPETYQIISTWPPHILVPTAS